jgi:DNA polymerase-1
MPVSRLFLIDAHALCYRSFFAIKELRNTKGQATNAVYGFVAALKKILRQYQPQYLAVCFDMKGKTLRQEKFADYKIQRPAMPDDLISQIPIIKDIVAAYNLPVIEMEGYEADDIIATVARRFKDEDLEIVIVSDDKDMFQLVNDHVKILNSRQDGILGTLEAEKILGFSPHQIPDYLALAGDQVDNIPGVKGIGEVSAKNLLAQYGSLKKILLSIDELKPERVRQAIAANKDMAQLSYQLALLEDQAPVEFDLEKMRVGSPQESRLKDIFTDMEFRKFAAELGSSASETTENVVAQRVSTSSEWSVIAKTFTNDQFFSFYLEPLITPGEIAPPQKFYVSGKAGKVFEISSDNLAWLKELFADAAIIKVTDDIKEQLKRLPADTVFKGQVFDVMLAGYLASPSRGNYDLAGLAWEYLKKTIAQAPAVEIEPALSVMVAAQLYPLLSEELKKRDLMKLFDELEIPLAFVLSKMEQEGVSIDEQLLSRLCAETSKRIDALTKDLYALAGEEFNLNSPKQLSQILFEKLKLPVVKKTKTGFSTDEGVLLKLADNHALPAKLLEYRQLAKLRSTYIDALPKLINPQTGKVHASFNQAVAETGRLSSSNPNLQNIPIRTELGRQIRAAFIPSAKDRVIISADYSQIELRVLAHLSGDANLKKAFEKNEDIHAYTAAQVFDIRESEVDAEMRNTAKRVNFGIIYGMSAFGLAKDLGINNMQAQDFIDRYFSRYPAVKQFMDQEILKCKKMGYVTTILNRRRYIPEINSPNMGLRQFAERQAINTPVQGSAADLIKLAMIQIQDELEKGKFASRMIITVHDELVFDAVVSEEKKLVAMIRERMENTMSLSVPIVASLKKGKNWLETEKIL